MRRAVRGLVALGLLAVLAAAPPSAAPASEPVLGRTVPGTGWYAMAADYKRSSRFTLASQATVTHLAAHLDGHGGASGSQQLRYALYDDHNGQPQNLLAQTGIGTISAGQAATWLRLPLEHSLTLSPGVYHLALLGGRTGNVARYSRSLAPNGLVSLWDTFSDGAANPHGTGTPAYYQLAIHALRVQPPQSLSPPEISGAARVGERLVASAGTWTSVPETLGYEWRRCDATGAGCVAIEGARESSYTIVAADAGRTLRVAVSAKDADGASTAVSAAVGPIADAPGSSLVFGRATPGSAMFAMAADYKRSSRFTLASQATVTHLAAHLDGHGGASGSQQVRYALYTDQYGQPQTLLAQTAVGTINAGQAATWLRLPLLNPLSLNPGTYHLALLGGGAGNVARYSRSPATNSLLSLRDTFSDGAANPHGTGTPAHYQVAIHALHEPGAAPAPPTDLTQKAASTTSVGVAWTASVGQVAGYTIYADDARVGTTSTTAYTVTGLACGRTYTIGVEAVSAAGKASARASVAATTAACPLAPAPPAGVTCDRVAAPGGSDSNAGTPASPYATPQKLADTLTSGQTGCLRAGTYSGGTYILTIARGGFRLRSYPGERARLVGIVYIKNGATNITLSHLDLEGTGAQNTVKVHATDAVIEHNTITNKGRGLSCMILGDNAGWGAAHRAIVRRNTFHDCGATANGNKDHGIYAANIADGQILNNVFWNTAGYAIHLYPNTQRTRVAHNVIDGAGPSVRGGIIVAGDASYTSHNNTIELNVVAYAATYNIETYWETSVGTGNIARKNCVWGARLGNILGNGLSLLENLVADPLFVDRSAHDYRLSTLSLCRLVVGDDVGP